MKAVAFAMLSVALAATTYLLLQGLLWVTFGFLSVVVLHPSLTELRQGVFVLELLILYASAFLTGMILTPVKPFFVPLVTVPLGTIAMWGLWGCFVFMEDGAFGLPLGWISLGGFVLSVGLVSLGGCIVATRTSRRRAKSLVPWFRFVGPLTVVACSSSVASMLLIALACARLDPDLHRALEFSLFAVAVIAVVTVVDTALVFVRAVRTASLPLPVGKDLG